MTQNHTTAIFHYRNGGHFEQMYATKDYLDTNSEYWGFEQAAKHVSVGFFEVYETPFYDELDDLWMSEEHRKSHRRTLEIFNHKPDNQPYIDIIEMEVSQ